MRRIKAELAQQALEEQNTAAKQLFMTRKGDDAGQRTGDQPSQVAHDGDVGKEQGNPPLAADPATEQLSEIHGGPRPLQPAIPVAHNPKDFTVPMDKVVYETLGEPITPDYVRDVNNLEQKRQAILKEAKRVEKMGEKLDGDIAKAQDTLKRARNMEEKYATLIQNQINEGGDPQLARNLEFTMPTAETLAKMYIKNPPYVDKNRDEVRATPIENIMAAKELLENNQSPTALETAVKLMTKALVQQEKATSSRFGSNLTLRYAGPVLLPRPRVTAIMVLALITNLIPDPQRPKEEKLAIGQTSSQYPLMTDHTAKASKGIHRHPTRTILLTDTTKTRPHPAISPTCRHQSTRRSKSHRKELSYATMMEIEEGVVTLAGETSRHDVKPVEMAGPSIGNHLAMTTARTTTATRISIALHAAAMTKGKAPAAMTMTQHHKEHREAAAVAEIHHRTSRVKGVNHPHQAAPMAAAVAAQPGHAPPEKFRRTRSHMTRVPT
jgi:hypothetical protein